MVKSLLVMLIFVTYWIIILNIYGSVIMNAFPTVAHCQHACKCFTLSVQLYCSAAYKILLTDQY